MQAAGACTSVGDGLLQAAADSPRSDSGVLCRQQMGAAPEITMQNRSMELVEGRGNVPLTDDHEAAHQPSLDTKADTDRHLQARPTPQCASAWCCPCSLGS